MENHGRKEEVSTAEYTIEHILPQNENLHPDWQRDIGPEWKDVQARLLHTLGNLTLTGYNPELSDRPFLEKRDMEGGFKNSPLRLNQGLGQLEVWNEAAIEKRAAELATQAIGIWKRPALIEELLAEYRTKFAESTGFDWSLTHDILNAVPAGRWTGYHYLGEAVGTAAQAIANHVSKCPVCAQPYRVLTWDGRIADGFAWTDPNDTRDPKDVLEAEGVRFIDGLADPEQKLGTEDLLALVEDDA
jgi:alkylated DNA nucleotide flippase Atl1